MIINSLVVTFILYGIWFIYRTLKNKGRNPYFMIAGKAKLSESDKKRIDYYLNHLNVLVLIFLLGGDLIFLGYYFKDSLLSDITYALGSVFISIAVAYTIYYNQAIQSLKLEFLLERKLGNKLDKINVSRLEKKIAELAAKEINRT